MRLLHFTKPRKGYVDIKSTATVNERVRVVGHTVFTDITRRQGGTIIETDILVYITIECIAGEAIEELSMLNPVPKRYHLAKN